MGKKDARVDAYGCVDELNSALGLVRATAEAAPIAEQILSIQKELVTVMGELATSPQDLTAASAASPSSSARKSRRPG